jgi:hypothetical protein
VALCSAVKAAAKAAGAFGCTISGAGPTCVAVTNTRATGEAVAAAMAEAFHKDGGLEVNRQRVNFEMLIYGDVFPCSMVYRSGILFVSIAVASDVNAASSCCDAG